MKNAAYSQTTNTQHALTLNVSSWIIDKDTVLASRPSEHTSHIVTNSMLKISSNLIIANSVHYIMKIIPGSNLSRCAITVSLCRMLLLVVGVWECSAVVMLVLVDSWRDVYYDNTSWPGVWRRIVCSDLATDWTLQETCTLRSNMCSHHVIAAGMRSTQLRKLIFTLLITLYKTNI